MFPLESVAEQLTVVVPMGNKEPDEGMQLTGTGPSIWSYADATKLTTAPDAFEAFTVILDGNVNTGGALSVTVMLKLPWALFPFESVAEQLTVVVPMGNREPDAGTQVTGTGPSTRSFADAVKLTTVSEALDAVTVISEGNVNAGGVVSTTVTLKLAVPIFPFVSVAVQLTAVVPRGKVAPESGEHDWDSTASSGSLAEAV